MKGDKELLMRFKQKEKRGNDEGRQELLFAYEV